MNKSWLRLNQAGGDGGGGANTFLTSLPEDLRAEPSLATFKDPATLAKSYVEAQKLIGHARVAIPGDKASPAEWEAFYNKIGRPETADKYETYVLKDDKGNVVYQPEEKEAADLKKFFHSMGLTAKQARQMQEYSAKYFHENMTAAEFARAQSAQQAQQALKQAWGDKFDQNVDTARATIKKFAGEDAEEILKFMDESGLGNNVPLVKLMAKIGESIMEDRGHRGGGDTLPVTDETRAKQEIAQLMQDQNFQKILNSREAVGHQEAKNRWMNLFKAAYPGQEKE